MRPGDAAGDVLVTVTVLVNADHITGDLLALYCDGTGIDLIADHVVASALERAGLGSTVERIEVVR